MECPCKRKKCERYGKCDECRKHHAETDNGSLPYCDRLNEKEKRIEEQKKNRNR